jgi:hypothetical protein
LVAGVSGGKSLIESAKIQGGIREINNLRIAFGSFYEAKDRLPGDPSGQTGIGRVKIINATGGCQTTEAYSNNEKFNNEYSSVSYLFAPFVDLYINNYWNFKPDSTKVSTKTIADQKPNINVPSFKYIGKDGGYVGRMFIFPNFYTIHSNSCYIGEGQTFSWYKLKKGVYSYVSLPDKNYMKPDIAKKFDTKLDDGIYNSGEVRGDCFSDVNSDGSFKDITYKGYENGKGCSSIAFFVINWI